MIVGAFSKRLRKHPPADDEILAGLLWIERMAQAVRGESDIADLPSADDEDPVNVSDDTDLPSADDEDPVNVSDDTPNDGDGMAPPIMDDLIPANW